MLFHMYQAFNSLQGTPSHTQQIFELLVLQVSIGVEMI